MAFTTSKVFGAFIGNKMDGTITIDLDGSDAFMFALYGNTITPNENASAANSAYNADQWVTGGEKTSGADWPAKGKQITSPDITIGTNFVMWDDNGSNLASGAAATLTDVFGGLTFDDTAAAPVADQGVCFNYLGGANSVAAGTFNVIFNTNGILRFTF